MKQRLGVAAAVLGNPRLVILDEPTSSIDPTAADQLESMLREYHKETGASVLFTSHSLAQVERLCDEVSVLFNGTLVGAVRKAELEPAGLWIRVEAAIDVVHGLLSPFAASAESIVSDGPSRTVLHAPALDESAALSLQQQCAARGVRIVDWRQETSPFQQQVRHLFTGTRRNTIAVGAA
jgi:ABC-2 type transport system ATP-binding protein